MPSTTPDGFEFETPDDEPARTLHGGESGTSPILAEQVQDKFTATDATLADHAARLAALEDGTGGVGWVPISDGVFSGEFFTIDLTGGGKFPNPPLWSVIEVHMRIDLDADGSIACRINDSFDPIYRSGGTGVNAEGAHDLTWHLVDATGWRIAYLSTVTTGNLKLTLFSTGHEPGLVNYQCTAGRQSDAPGVHRYNESWGSLASGAGGFTVSSLRFDPGNGATSFVNAWWWATGLRTVAPS